MNDARKDGVDAEDGFHNRIKNTDTPEKKAARVRDLRKQFELSEADADVIDSAATEIITNAVRSIDKDWMEFRAKHEQLMVPLMDATIDHLEGFVRTNREQMVHMAIGQLIGGVLGPDCTVIPVNLDDLRDLFGKGDK